jgi:hypothetical protein
MEGEVSGRGKKKLPLVGGGAVRFKVCCSDAELNSLSVFKVPHVTFKEEKK